LTQDGVYKLSDDLKATLVHDKKIIKKINEMANKFKMIDRYVCEKDKIWKGR
jgi:sulfur relay (sulfurtransferase) DsrF/TusC family protein